jgi:uncharacterized protein
MIIVISPSKTLDESPTNTHIDFSQPEWLDESQKLVNFLNRKTPDDLSELMNISGKLALLNNQRFSDWQPPFNTNNAKQAVLLFQGDVYLGLQAHTFTQQDFDFAQQHLRILSGLYGLLKPLDLMQPYRLEMGTDLKYRKSKNLYQFWGDKLARNMNKTLVNQGDDLLINLASNEYFKALPKAKLKARIITPIFKDWKNGKLKVISFFAKKARGMMSRYIIQNQLRYPEQLKSFDEAGYQYDNGLSTNNELVFTREEITK